ncbi:GTP 3',8-cyclase MoaA [Desulfovibrio sp. UCD-KL4C]|uniref:GTP 3',8-cyclase MoaA n=1 Tax=Desulfovibrio sp. UCD-KL4C TaxID=2578120 RepID=UPI0025BDFDB0|nr:GTP 3',8-cyclase MoaA [Desulfovibrio sp. UCD-KL4C]
MNKLLVDSYGRKSSYMRISVTDRCNLNCTYCAGEGFEFIPHARVLRYEEIFKLMELATDLGVRKIRFTGGEPFVRKGFVEFLIEAAARFSDLELCVTTNGTLIGNCVEKIAFAGIKRINISLDTLNPARFKSITGHDKFDLVLENIDRCLKAGMTVKVNSVAMKNVNDDELADFIGLAGSLPLDMRFIEFMPVGLDTGWTAESIWSAEDIIAQAREFAELSPCEEEGANSGPARMFSIVGGKGRLGVISPHSNHFCSTCNRLRISSDGNLRSCLFSDKVYRLRAMFRNPKVSGRAVEKVFKEALRHKPVGHDLLELMPAVKGVCRTRMASIGG